METLLNLSAWVQLTFIPLIILAFFLYFWGKLAAAVQHVENQDFCEFQDSYYLPYLLGLFSDWLQGPYLYELYDHYGFDESTIAIFYTVGFASSAVFGTLTGQLADKFGRKKMVLLFCLLYSLSCLTTLHGNFWILIMGRIFGGTSYSILSTVFESWYIHEHVINRKYPIEWVSLTLSKAMFFNGLLAIVAGLVAQSTSEWLHLGPISPFVMAIPFLIAMAILVACNWTENYGEKEVKFCVSCGHSLTTIFKNKKVLSLALIQTLFETNLFIFVFLWTPVLTPGNPPVGLTFASFMVAIMVGSNIYSLLLLQLEMKPEVVLRYCLALMGISLVLCSISIAPEFQTNYKFYLTFVSFLLLEVSVGMFNPCIGRLKGEIIPDEWRANIMNWFRVPMNIIICMALLGLSAFGEKCNARVNQVTFAIGALTSFVGLMICLKFLKPQVTVNSVAEKQKPMKVRWNLT